MERILFLSPVPPSGELSRPALETLTAALELARAQGGALVIGLVGSGAAAAASRLGGAGADRVLAVTGADFDAPRYSSDVAALAALVARSEPSLVLAPAGSRISRALPGAAVRAGGVLDTHITALAPEPGALSVERWYYRQRMRARFTRSRRPWFLTIDPGLAAPWAGAPAAAPLEEIAVAAPAGGWRTRAIGEESIGSGAQTIRPDAELLFVAGAGWMKKQADGATHVREAGDLIRSFLEATQASLGSSKSLVDQSAEGAEVIPFMSHLHQVGQTGSTPRHRKGLATCCHGEEPHVVGWRFIQERRAVNLDPNCGWARGKADVVYVADAFRVVAKLNEILAGGD